MTNPKKLTPTQVRNRQKWIAALRSGKYKKGINALHRGNRYCCLGVACKLDLATPLSGSEYLSEWDDLGLMSMFGRLDYNDDLDLSDLNDGRTADHRQWTFSEIADLIELDTESRK